MLYPKGALIRWMICNIMTNEQLSIIIVMKFWNVMNTLLYTIFVFTRKLPFTISMGLADEMTTAGNQPAIDPTMSTISNMAPIHSGWNNTVKSKLHCSKLLTGVTTQKANKIAMDKAIKHKITDSPINLQNSSLRVEPKSRQIAISLARNPAWATVRLI